VQDWSPIGAAHFLDLGNNVHPRPPCCVVSFAAPPSLVFAVKMGYYDGVAFNRAVDNFLVQFGQVGAAVVLICPYA
jgi:cyclophilin family peptidyl-prolyl cis-trans isomerase